MSPTAFDEETSVLGPPKGMTENEVISLSVYQNGEVTISCWKPTKEELEEINKTGRVWLVISGPTMQPAYLTGLNPFLKQNPET